MRPSSSVAEPRPTALPDVGECVYKVDLRDEPLAVKPARDMHRFPSSGDALRQSCSAGDAVGGTGLVPQFKGQPPMASAIERGKRVAEKAIAPPGTIQGRIVTE